MPAANMHSLIAGTLLGVALAAPAAALDLFGPSCLEKLTERTRVWTECTHTFDRNDDRCQLSAGKMQANMQKCAKDGKSKAQIDAAMNQGYRLAGRRPLHGGQQDVVTPAPNGKPASDIAKQTLSKISRQARAKDEQE